ncbi:MAG TPA: hypothetical protein VKZ79_19515 [Alphaproteobacteria bacterium]|nr:hypothetical protein [Alphaproteobacteria bacterium]
MNGAETIADEAEDQDHALRAEWVAAQLGDLARLRALSMEMAERVATMQAELCAKPSPEAVELCATLTLSMTRITRSVRQLVALEQEAAGLRDPKSMAAWRSRNRETARTLRAAVGREVKRRLPGTDRESLKSLLCDLFRDYDDYDDYSDGRIAPLVERVTERLSRQRGGMTDEMLLDQGELDRLLQEELDRLAKFQQEHGRMPTEADADFMDDPGSGGHDPP